MTTPSFPDSDAVRPERPVGGILVLRHRLHRRHTDDDGDGFNELAEFTAKSDPVDPLSPGSPDGDGDDDGLDDRWEVANFTT
jgi:hypothetical protein